MKSNNVEEMTASVVDAVKEKKGTEIKVLDLSQVDGASTQNFVICTGRSTSQVGAIADSVQEMMKKNLGESPVNVHGVRNSQWIIIDYGSVMVHVFTPEFRTYYDLEGLWSDAPVKEYADE